MFLRNVSHLWHNRIPRFVGVCSWVPEQLFQEYVLRNAGPREFAVATNKYWRWMKLPIIKVSDNGSLSN